ncbi:hypothetical protein GF327_01180 [Candidatus Woesearchaeota archaeon]|nr:hypothetical protein [Candidatus Woesearchaeota archaeon]
MSGGNIDKKLLKNSFEKIKKDIRELNQELLELKKEHKRVLEENINLRKELKNSSLDQNTIKEIVSETIKNIKQEDPYKKKVYRKIKRNKKYIIKNRIIELANKRNLTLPEIRDIIIEEDRLCSKATFYRYVNKLKKKQILDEAELEDKTIIIKI